MEKVKVGTARISVPTPINKPLIMQKMTSGSVVPSAHGRKLTNPKADSKKAKQEKKAETSKPEKPKREHKGPTDEQLYEALVKAYKGTPLSSREISDAAGISDPEVGRAAVRNAMKRLIAAGKVEGVEPEKGRATLVYKPKA